MEILIEVILDLFLDPYLELMVMIVPEKNVTKGMRVLAIIIAVVLTLGLLALFLFGASLLFEKNTVWGLILMIVSALLALAQIIAGIVLYKKHH